MKKSYKLAIFLAAGAAAFPATTQAAGELIAGWDFEKLEADGTSIKNSAGDGGSYVGVVANSAILTDANGGRPGGGKGFDVSMANPGWLQFEGLDVNLDNNPLNKAAANDQMTIVLWERNNSNVNSSSFWAAGEGFNRAFQFHAPWSDGTIYFDTAGGCCSTPGQRLSKNVVGDLPDFDWLAWHHYAFVKDGGAKRIYIDGKLFQSQDEGADPLPTEYNRMAIGAVYEGAPGATPDGVIDDFGIYKGALTEAEINAVKDDGFVKPPDTDSDGMPDPWETQYGLNPNDATDATKDCDEDGTNNLAEYTAGTDPCDEVPPTLVSASGAGSVDSVTLTFSEAMDPVEGAKLANYSISPTLAITAATVTSSKVVLTTARQAAGVAYTVTVSAVSDISKNVIAGNPSSKFYARVSSADSVKNIAAVLVGNATFTSDTGGHSGKAGDYAIDHTAAGGPLRVADVTFANAIAAADEMSVSIWVKKYDIADSSAFMFNSPSSASAYGFQAHVPWSNNNVYFDTAGCCDADERINAGIDSFSGYTGDNTWWTGSWHHFVFSKKADYKQIWIDGLLFLDGTGAKALPTDFKFLYIGGQADTAALSHGLSDDFAVFSTQLTEAQVKSLQTGTAPSALPAAAGLVAYWSFDDIPTNGIVSGATPAPGAASATPYLVGIKHLDGSAAWDKTKVSLTIDNAPVAAIVDKVGATTTVSYAPNPVFASKSAHNAALVYDGATVFDWSFTNISWTGPTKDKVGSYQGLVTGSGVYTADKGGHTGAAGDYGLDATKKGGPVLVGDTTFLAAVNAAMASDEFSVAYWAKRYDLANSSAFGFRSPSSGAQGAFHAHVPYSDGSIYFDTVGCCDPTTQRINAAIDTFVDYTGATVTDPTWWTNSWHLFAFTKKGSVKNIYIDGKLFLPGDSTSVLPTDVNLVYLGAYTDGSGPMHAILDDYSVYSKELTEADVLAIKNGTLPTALPPAKGLIGYWDFNDATATGGGITNLKAALGAPGKVKITFDGTGVIQGADTLNGTYTDTTIKNGDEVDAAGVSKYYRGKQ